VTQKEKEAAALAEKYRQEVESSGTKPIVEEEVKQAASEDAASDVALQTVSRRDSDQSLDKIKQKLKKEKDAHQSTEFRLKVRPDTFVVLLLCYLY
jgi:hypothetical protein